MPSGCTYLRTPVRATTLLFALALLPIAIWGQRPPTTVPSGPPVSPQVSLPGSEPNTAFELEVAVRDAHGEILEGQAFVRLYSPMGNYDQTSPTRGPSGAHFPGIGPGEYQVEVTCPGFRKTTEHVTLMTNFHSLPIYIYLVPENDAGDTSVTSQNFVLPQQFRAEMQKGMGALSKNQYAAAQKIFAKVLQKVPSNPDVFYFLGIAEVGLLHLETAREDFQRALALDPNHELALVSLGHLQIRSGAAADAIILLEKAVSTNRAGWRASFDLADAYFKVNRLSAAETEASRAVRFAKEKGAASTYLLGVIQNAEGKHEEAKRTLESILKTYPTDSVASDAKKMLAGLGNDSPGKSASTDASLTLPLVPEVNLATASERPWAPLDIDSAVYEVAPNENCRTELILDGALHRMNSDLLNFEKFTATEHVERQEIDRNGWPGPMKTHDSSYIVFVYPYGIGSFYVTEFRGGEDKTSASSGTEASANITSTNLNSMGVNVLQPIYRPRFDYSCEGLSNVRGQAAWQIHFVEKRDAKGEGVRLWKLNYETYAIPVKGRIWISSTSFAVLRVETDLREPVRGLELTRDHLLVDYGPVNFLAGDKQLWLPWSADSYMERRGKRYHHRHSLRDYLLFNVDTTHKVGKPSELPAPPAGSSR